LLVLWSAFIARMTLWPHPSLHTANQVLTQAVGSSTSPSGRIDVAFGWWEHTANVALFVPFGLLLQVLWRRWWWVVATGAVTSGSIEAAQAIWLPFRTATIDDVVDNTLGTAVGCLVAIAAVDLWRRRR
jgi:glycopeptide antibiotics resistance protein